jgi:hypothetical protein
VQKTLKRLCLPVELYFQIAVFTLMALEVPRTHPVVVRFTSRFMHPQELYAFDIAPYLTVFAAKLIVDSATFWDWPVLGWTGPRPPRTELLHPFSIRYFELSNAASAAGVLLGRLSSGLRHALGRGGEAAASMAVLWTPGFGIFPTSTVRALTAVASTLWQPLWHITACWTLAPAAVWGLAALFREAQLRHQLLISAAAGAILRACSRQKALEEPPYWEGVRDEDVPDDMLCPITGQPFVHPIVLHGMVFEEAAARRWVSATSRHPVLRDVRCCAEDFLPARDLETLCHRLATELGWTMGRRTAVDMAD